MNKTTLYIGDETQRRLRSVARRTGRRQADLIREALDRYLDAEPVQEPGSIGVGEDPELTAAETEDWLRANWRPR